MQYEKVITQLRKISDKVSEARPILKGVYHNNDTVLATDSHRLAQVKIKNANYDETVIDFKNDSVLEGNYPDIEKLFLPEDDKNVKIELSHQSIVDLKSLLACIKALKFENVEIKKNDKGHWYLVPQHTTNGELKGNSHVTMNYFLTKDDDKADVETKIFDVKYLLNALELMKESKIDGKIIMSNHPFKPMQIESDDDNSETQYRYLIMPKRNY